MVTLIYSPMQAVVLSTERVALGDPGSESRIPACSGEGGCALMLRKRIPANNTKVKVLNFFIFQFIQL